MKKRVADIVMDTLADLGVEQAFCVVGGGSMYLNNALGISKRIKTIYCHHEQACAMAAEGYFRTTGKMAAVCVTSGPGGTNTLTGVMGSYVDNCPVLIISGQVRYETSIAAMGVDLRTNGEQEFPIVPVAEKMCKYAKMVIDPLTIRAEVEKAIDIALDGRRGHHGFLCAQSGPSRNYCSQYLGVYRLSSQKNSGRCCCGTRRCFSQCDYYFHHCLFHGGV